MLDEDINMSLQEFKERFATPDGEPECAFHSTSDRFFQLIVPLTCQPLSNALLCPTL